MVRAASVRSAGAWTAHSASASAPGSAQIAALSGAAPAPISAVASEPRTDIRPSSPVEAIVNQLTEVRQTARSLRPELPLRHSEFGAVNVRIDATGSDLRATLASRDPGFVPAIQAALNERMVTQAVENAPGQSSKGSDQNQSSHSSSHSSSQGQSAGSGGLLDGRYGSSPGSGQGSPQPYRGQSEGNESDGSLPDQSGLTGERPENAGDAGLFA
jgi:hypothetical protein